MGCLSGKVALVTGAARGQGRAHALTLAREGAAVVAVDVPAPIASTPYPVATSADLAETARLVRQEGGRILPVEGDVRRQESLDRAVADGVAEFGRIDICIANAGIWNMAPAWELSEDQWGTMLDINLSGVWRTVKAVMPTLIEQGDGGSLVLTSSMNGLEPGGSCAHYTAAKHGVVGLMRSLALELAPHGIRSNAVCPGSIDTPMVNWRGAYDVFSGGSEGSREDFVAAGKRYAALREPVHCHRSRWRTLRCGSSRRRPSTSPASRCRSTPVT